MHNERCMSGSARGHAKPATARSLRRAWPTRPYLPMAHGFQHLVAIIDVGSRKTLSWRVSNTMTPDFCVEALQEALGKYGKPEIFNTDQGSQFTCGGMDRYAQGRRSPDQHGRQGSMDRQRVYRAAVALMCPGSLRGRQCRMQWIYR